MTGGFEKKEYSTSEAVDFFRNGLDSGPRKALHPVQEIETKGKLKAESLKLEMLNAVYGRHAAEFRIRMLAATAQQTRLPGSGLKSSLLSYELVAGTDDSIELAEFPYIEKVEDTTTSTGVICSNFGAN